MTLPTTRAEFKTYCLRKLGDGVIEINVSDQQVEDRIDEALSYYADYHYDGAEKIYFKYQVTDADRTNKYITIPENMIGVVNIFPINGALLGGGIFNVQYQFVLNNIADFSSYSMLNYYMTMQNISFMQDMLSGLKPIRYNRHVNKLYIDTNWDMIPTGTYIIVECYSIINPNDYPDVWKDRWLANYASAKIQQVWGRNLTKFTGMTMPGNMQFNGDRILDDATAQIDALESEMLMNYSLPPLDQFA